MFNKFGAYKSDFILFWRVPSDNKEQQIFLVVSMWLLWFLWNDKNIKILLEIENCRAFFFGLQSEDTSTIRYGISSH